MVEDTNYSKTVDEYKEKLLMLSEQARKDGRGYVSDFLEALVKHSSINADLYDYIYTSADDISKDMVNIYMLLLEKNKTLEWYALVSCVNDEKNNPEQWYPIILNCLDTELQAADIQTLLYESYTAEEFERNIQQKLMKKNDELPEKPVQVQNEFIEHLRAENMQLNQRLDASAEELRIAREEAKTALEESFVNKKHALEYKLELEQLKKSGNASTLAVKMAECRTQQYKAMSEQLEATANHLRERNKQLEFQSAEYERHMLELSEHEKELEIQLHDKDMEITTVKSEFERYKAEHDRLAYQEDLPNQMSFEMGEFPEGDALYDMSGMVDAPDFFEGNEELLSAEDDEPDYDENEVIEIKDNKTEVVKHTNLFATILMKHQEKKFKKKSQTEQESLIFIKMMEKSFSKEMVQTVRSAMKNDSAFSRYGLYELISKNASEQELSRFCGALN